MKKVRTKGKVWLGGVLVMLLGLVQVAGGEEILDRLSQRLGEKRAELVRSKNRIEEAQRELKPLRERIDTLEGQLENLNWLIGVSEKKIKNVEKQVQKKEIDLGGVYEKREFVALRMEEEKRKLKDYAVYLYRLESQFYDFEEGKLDYFKLVLAEGAMGKAVNDLRYLARVQSAEKKLVGKLQETEQMLRIQEQEVNQVRADLNNLEEELKEEKLNLEVARAAKRDLLAVTKGQEKKYQEMLAESIRQQEQAEEDIKQLKREYINVERQLNSMSGRAVSNNSGVKVYSNIVDYESLEEISKILGEKHQTLDWPVDPSRGVTAYYQDEGYRQTFGVPHEGIDLRAYQGSEIYAPADGLVYKVRDNGYGYSYLILAHRDNVLTVYGHLSGFEVEEGDLVMQGDLIGYSGGMPGTKGAGSMTTGPHLHFEVYKDGYHVDPLDYLPVFMLPGEYIPDRYLDELEGTKWQEVLEGEGAEEEGDEGSVTRGEEKVEEEKKENEEGLVERGDFTDGESGMGVD